MKYGIMIMASLLLAGCSWPLLRTGDAPLAPRLCKSFDLQLNWDYHRDGGRFIIAGTVTNIYFSPLLDLELTATLLNDRLERLADASMFFIPPLIGIGQRLPFSLEVPLQGGYTPHLVRFTTHYTATDHEFGPPPHFHAIDCEVQ